MKRHLPVTIYHQNEQQLSSILKTKANNRTQNVYTFKVLLTVCLIFSIEANWAPEITNSPTLKDDFEPPPPCLPSLRPCFHHLNFAAAILLKVEGKMMCIRCAKFHSNDLSYKNLSESIPTKNSQYLDSLNDELVSSNCVQNF